MFPLRFFLFSLLLFGNTVVHSTTYYISPAGNDNNPGTQAQPWQTLAKTAIALTAGDTAIFEDGTYLSDRVNFIFHAGTKDNPIVIKSRNKHGAKLEFSNTSTLSIGIYKPYIEILDFEIFKTDPGNHSGYIVIALTTTTDSQGDYCTVKGNKIHHSFGRGITGNKVKGAIISDNELTDISTSAITLFATDSSFVRNNILMNNAGSGIVVQAGSKSVQVYNNELTINQPMVYGILLGGLTAINTGLVADFSTNGYECFNCVAFNNKIEVTTFGDLDYGYAIQSGKDCAVLNNIVSGAKYGLGTLFLEQHIANGWDWNPTNTNYTFKNNIVTNATLIAANYDNDGIGGTPVSDYNLFFRSRNALDEPNSVYFDPCFINFPTNCQLNPNSRGVNAAMACTFTGYYGENIEVNIDKNGITRTVPWDMGIYDIAATPTGDGVCNPTTYYLSTTGSDDNPGTVDLPWKTLFKASITLAAGDSLIVEDGEYLETVVTSFTLNPGTKEHPIVVTARNKHQAKIIYQDIPGDAFLISQPYVIIQDLDISKAERGTTTADVIIAIRIGGDFCTIRGNKIHNAYEEGVKSYKTKGLIIEENIFYDFTHEAIDFVAVDSSIIRHNDISAVQRIGILAGKGGAKSIQVYNNTIRINNQMCCGGYGIILGGSSSAAPVDNTTTSGYEAWNIVAFNNLIISETPGAILVGLSITGGKNCAFYNNMVVGAQIGLQTQIALEDLENGWDWAPTNDHPVFINNIILNSTVKAVDFPAASITGTPEMDYNLYFNNPNEPVEPHSIYADPKLININSDWYLQADSPAINEGTSWSFTGYFGETILGNRDIENIPRNNPWDIGPYEVDYGNLCIETDKFFTDTIKNRVYQYENTITTALKLATDANVTFKAGQTITLLPGFQAVSGSFFLAKIESCTPVSDFVETTELNKKVTDLNYRTPVANATALTIAPNPANGYTTISFYLEKKERIHLGIYGMSGQLITLIDPTQKMDNGFHEYPFNTSQLQSGMYFIYLNKGGKKITTKKLIVLR